MHTKEVRSWLGRRVRVPVSVLARQARVGQVQEYALLMRLRPTVLRPGSWGWGGLGAGEGLPYNPSYN